MCPLKSIRTLCRTGAEARAAGDGQNAGFFLHQAYAQARGLNSPLLEAKILNTMGVFALEDRQAETARALLSRARDMVQARIGEKNKLYAVIAGNLRQAEDVLAARG